LMRFHHSPRRKQNVRAGFRFQFLLTRWVCLVNLALLG